MVGKRKKQAALFTRANRQLAGDLRYLSQAALLQEQYTPRVIRAAMLCVSIGILCFIVWSRITYVSEMARTKGSVVPDGYLQLVQHPEGGIISRILVEEGQLVKHDQVLVELDARDPGHDLREMKTHKTALMLQAERLRAFIENHEPVFDTIDGTTEKMIEDQKRMFADMMQAREEEKEVVQAQIEQKKQILNGLESRNRTVGQTLSLVNEERKMQETLMQQGLTSKLRFLEKKKEHTRVWGELETTRTQILEAKEAISEFDRRLATLDSSHRDQASRQLEEVENELATHHESLAKQTNRMERLSVRAPVDGLVKGLEINTIGGVVGAGQTLMQIVPLNAQLVVEAQISPKDIGHAVSGMPVQVKVHAFDYTRYGAIDGVLEFISATTFINEQNQSYYRGRIRLKRNYVGENPELNIVLPGMTVDAEIITGRKTVLDYLLKPVQMATSTAFTER